MIEDCGIIFIKLVYKSNMYSHKNFRRYKQCPFVS